MPTGEGYLTVSVKESTRDRLRELKNDGEPQTYDELIRELLGETEGP